MPTPRSPPAVSDTTQHPLSLAFMREHPAQAASVLDALPASDAAQLLSRVPARLGGAVLAAMLPHRAGLCIASLDDERVQELLAPMATQPKVALLRHLPEPRRQRLVAGLPTAAALASALLLGFSEDALGAWADPDVVMLGADTRVSDALERARSGVLTHPMVFVCDASRRLVGAVPLAVLIAAPGLATLASMAQRPAAVLAANASLAGAAAHPGWAHASALPVVEAGQRLVGLLTSDALARALRRSAPPTMAESASEAWPQLLARGYWQAMAGLMEVGLSVLPRVPPLMPADTTTSSVPASVHASVHASVSAGPPPAGGTA